MWMEWRCRYGCVLISVSAEHDFLINGQYSIVKWHNGLSKQHKFLITQCDFLTTWHEFLVNCHSLPNTKTLSQVSHAMPPGLQLFASNRPQLAALCFDRAAKSMYESASLWLRRAECCVAVYLNDLRQASRSERPQLVQCQKVLEKRVFEGKSIRHNSVTGVPAALVESVRSTQFSLQYALVCLRNSIHLLDLEMNASEGDSSSTRSVAPLKRVKEVALLNMMFISLAVNDPHLCIHCHQYCARYNMPRIQCQFCTFRWIVWISLFYMSIGFIDYSLTLCVPLTRDCNPAHQFLVSHSLIIYHVFFSVKWNKLTLSYQEFIC